ncbi:hypothetical protein GCM10009416_02810 [Craurococcus roseus]|uniref:Uncharacterized protein n=1 Tax=Craurococcus roseus TaxID=77585 RepID=A0ABP3PQ85_9PROT
MPRLRHSRSASPGRKPNGAGAWRGPSSASPTSAAPATAASEAAPTVSRQSSPPRALTRCGEAEPKVSPPTSRATTKPVSPRSAQPAASFIPTG